jgi:hypothetical protein
VFEKRMLRRISEHITGNLVEKWRITYDRASSFLHATGYYRNDKTINTGLKKLL